jgi:hypothetical protein
MAANPARLDRTERLSGANARERPVDVWANGQIALPCAREDSNLHELSAHKALKSNLKVCDASAPVFLGLSVRAKGRKGRI